MGKKHGCSKKADADQVRKKTIMWLQQHQELILGKHNIYQVKDNELEKITINELIEEIKK